MKKNIIVAVVIVVAVFVALAGVKMLQITKIIGFSKAFAPPPETISSAVARQENWQDTLTAVGSVTADQGVMVSPEIAGTVSEIDFESGATVQKGDLLVIRSNFSIKRSDFGLQPGKMENKVSDTITLTLGIAGASAK